MPLITEPSKEPVTLDETKKWCDIEHDDDDSLIDRLIAGSRRQVEIRTQSSLVRQKHRLYLDRFPNDCIYLPYGPVKTIDQIQYVDINGVTQTVSLSPTIYVLDHEDRVGLSYGQTWPATRYQKNAIWIDYWAGYFDPTQSPIKLLDAIPDDLRMAIMMMVRDIYDNPSRQHAVELYENKAFDMLIEPHRNYTVA